MMVFGFKDITGWTKGTERINGVELFFKDHDHLIEKWETLKPDRRKTHFEIRTSEKTRKIISKERKKFLNSVPKFQIS